MNYAIYILGVITFVYAILAILGLYPIFFGKNFESFPGKEKYTDNLVKIIFMAIIFGIPLAILILIKFLGV